MDQYKLYDLYWIYDLERRKLSVFVKNSSNTRVKNIMTGSICDIPMYHGDYGMERSLDFNKILNTKDYIQYRFKEIYAIVGTKAFSTLTKEEKQVRKEIKRQEKSPYYYDYSPYDMPEINDCQYMLDSDIVDATLRAEPILQQNSDVKRREQQCKNSSSLEF